MRTKAQPSGPRATGGPVTSGDAIAARVTSEKTIVTSLFRSASGAAQHRGAERKITAGPQWQRRWR